MPDLIKNRIVLFMSVDKKTKEEAKTSEYARLVSFEKDRVVVNLNTETRHAGWMADELAKELNIKCVFQYRDTENNTDGFEVFDVVDGSVFSIAKCDYQSNSNRKFNYSSFDLRKEFVKALNSFYASSKNEIAPPELINENCE